jgi:RHS repeat-associated protein
MGAGGGTTLAGYAYTLGATGNRLSAVEHGGRTVSYTYDALYRLTGETIAAGAAADGQLTYTYDAVGNRLARNSTAAGVPSSVSAYDANDRLSSDTYDANGNTTASQGRTYAYDFENRLTGVDGGAVRFTYDGDGNRVAKTANGVTTRYLVDTNSQSGLAQVVEELTGGVVSRRYTYGLSRISQSQPLAGAWTTHFYMADGHGNVRALADAAGAVTDTYAYDAFGNMLARTGSTPNEFLYCGEQFDPNVGFYYNRARYLDPSSGRFMTMDTYEGSQHDPASLHKYLYAHADPVNNLDPSGHASAAEMTFTAGLQAQLVALSNVISTFMRIYWGFSAVADIIQSVFGIARALQTGQMLTALQESLDSFRQLGLSLSYNQVVGSFMENFPRILTTGMPQWGPSMFQSLMRKSIRIKHFLIYMPTIVKLPEFEMLLPAAFNIRGIGIKLMFGGPGTQVLGGGVEMTKGLKRQLFRMDLSRSDFSHGNPAGTGAKAKGGEIDIWHDPPFHYHVMKY